jgi:uncharacterized phage protein gp47/JayE
VSPDQIDTPGSDINLILAGVTAMAEEVVRQGQRCVFDQTLSGARGAQLDRVVQERTGGQITRKEAAPSLVSLTLTRPNNTGGAGTYPAGSSVQTEGGVRFRTLQSATFTASGLGPVTVNAEAEEAGLQGNVAAGTITRFLTIPFDPSIQVTNPAGATGGDDTESDASLVQRTQDFFEGLGAGIASTVRLGALGVPGVRQATVEELVDSNGLTTGFTVLYIADANGQANQQLIDRVRIGINDSRAYGAALDIIGATPRFVEIQYRPRFTTGIDTSAAFETLRQATVANVAQLSPNAILERSLLFDVGRQVTGLIVLDDFVVDPAGDVVPAAGEVLRTRLDLITAAAP